MVKRGLTAEQALVGVVDFLGLAVQVALVGAAVVDAVFLAAGDAQLDLQRHAHLRHALEVAHADVEVLLDRLLGQVEHVRAEQRATGALEVGFAGIEQAIDPAELVLGAVVGVQDHASAVGGGQRVHVVRGRDRAGDRRCVALQAAALAGHERAAAVGELDDDGAVDPRRCLHHGVDGVAAGAVGCGQREAALLGQGEELGYGVAGEDAGGEVRGSGHAPSVGRVNPAVEVPGQCAASE